MANKDTSKNYTFTCPKVFKEKFEQEFVEEKKQQANIEINTSKLFRALMEILLEKKEQIDLSNCYDARSLKEDLEKGIKKEKA